MFRFSCRQNYETVRKIDVARRPRGFDMLSSSWGRVARRGRVRLVAFGRDRAAAASMSHVAWDGFAHHDTIFPLFLFIAGVSFPTRSPSSVREECPRGASMPRSSAEDRRLVVLGMVYNGLFKLDFENLRIASVLGRIGLAWSIAAVLYLNFGVKTRAAIAVAVLAGYGALSALVAAPDAAGAGPLTFEGIWRISGRRFLPGKLIRVVRSRGCSARCPPW